MIQLMITGMLWELCSTCVFLDQYAVQITYSMLPLHRVIQNYYIKKPKEKEKLVYYIESTM